MTIAQLFKAKFLIILDFLPSSFASCIPSYVDTVTRLESFRALKFSFESFKGVKLFKCVPSISDYFSKISITRFKIFRTLRLSNLEGFRLKLSKLESFRALKPSNLAQSFRTLKLSNLDTFRALKLYNLGT